MKYVPITARHRQKLTEYNLTHIPEDSVRYVRFEPGETISKEDCPINSIYLVVRGRAKVCRTASNGGHHILCYYVSDGIIGEIELLTSQKIAACTTITISDFECIAINYHACAGELKTNPVFLFRLGTALAEKVSNNGDNLVSIALHSGEQRLCAYILKTSHRDIFSDVLTDVACSVGISYRHMFRILGHLCDEKILEKRPNGYLILNHRLLTERSGQ